MADWHSYPTDYPGDASTLNGQHRFVIAIWIAGEPLTLRHAVTPEDATETPKKLFSAMLVAGFITPAVAQADEYYVVRDATTMHGR